ncbi:hypothetical protein EWM64_g10614 [Hericium alpestre]|uniref:Uncharacterized protein n=1 Tax=Hericium alpestre TaxID=135208 RepID=A0A4Y9ZI25_9AGAM|nr:hypothetical protein EWM64_g10614 [Hericium alpestre]
MVHVRAHHLHRHDARRKHHHLRRRDRAGPAPPRAPPQRGQPPRRVPRDVRPPGSDGQAARLQPPFSFEMLQNVKIAPADPARGKLLCVSLPDLAMHRAAMEEGVGAESDEDEAHPGLPEGNVNHEGMFHGDWSRRFIKRAQAREELEPLEKTVWDRNRVCDVRLKLEPIPHSVVKSRIYFENEPADAEDMEYMGLRKTRLEGYRIKATVVEVYIARSFFQESEGDTEAAPEA